MHSQAVTAITDNNRTDCVAAMTEFWGSLAGSSGLFSELVDTCHKLAGACNQYAQAIDDAHSRLRTALIEAGIAVGVTTVIGILLTPFSFGGSDTAAAAEAEAVVGADVAASLESVATNAPDVVAVEAETADVNAAIEEELSATEGETPQPPTVSTALGRIGDVLRPGGRLIGEQGNRLSCRLVENQEQLDAVWKDLSEGAGEPESVGPGGQIQRIDLGNGNYLQYRPFSKTGGPTIDVDVVGEPIKTIHIKPS